MNARSLQTVLRTLKAEHSAVDDGELLKQYTQKQDAEAFTQLIQRHAGIVWAVCRHSTRSDAEAEDAFQATVLVLIRNAGKIRDANKLASWLHGVAFRVCSKMRQSDQRRIVREKRGAVSEVDRHPPESAWDRTLAAVHEEVAKLPENLRVPFITCCLGGMGVTEASQKLGWKLGTLSGRLTKAKDLLLKRLEVRGLPVCAAAMATLMASTSVAPAALVSQAAALTLPGVTIPSSILTLTQGVLGMSMKSVKILAAGIMLAAGLSLNGGTWFANADAQQPATPPAVQVKPFSTAKVAGGEFEYVTPTIVSRGEFEKIVKEREAKGWSFQGQVALKSENGERVENLWVFRRKPAEVAYTSYWAFDTPVTPVYELYGTSMDRVTKDAGVELLEAQVKVKQAYVKAAEARVIAAKSKYERSLKLGNNISAEELGNARADMDAAAAHLDICKAELAEVEVKLKTSRKSETARLETIKPEMTLTLTGKIQPETATFNAKDYGLESYELIGKLGAILKAGQPNATAKFSTNGSEVTVTGTKDVIEYIRTHWKSPPAK